MFTSYPDVYMCTCSCIASKHTHSWLKLGFSGRTAVICPKLVIVDIMVTCAILFLHVIVQKRASCYFREVSTAAVIEDFEGNNFNVDSVISVMPYPCMFVINSFNEVDTMNCLHGLCGACIRLWQHRVHTGVWIKLGFIYIHFRS